MSNSLYELSRNFNTHIDKIIKEKQDLLSEGSCPDFASYKNECGLINGLSQAKQELRKVITSIVREDEQEEDEE
jgi:hypothetical protein